MFVWPHGVHVDRELVLLEERLVAHVQRERAIGGELHAQLHERRTARAAHAHLEHALAQKDVQSELRS